ncbi:MAG: class I SAM-dependent methyltransferase [Campylobacteraceae bacterium]|nr:class I SAM-dependent methyltransferase [Campylobacteraceae bacterium]
MNIKEEEIRPVVISNYNREVLFYEDIELFHKKFKNDLIKVEKCIACDCRNIYFIFNKDGFEFSKCNSCKTVFVSSRPNDFQLKWWYTHSKSQLHSVKILESTQDARKALYERRVDLFLDRIDKEVKTFLEIGPGNGQLLEIIKNKINGSYVKGIDLNPNAVDACNKKGIDCDVVDINDMAGKINEKYDAIMAFEVLEHLPNVKKSIKNVSETLNEGGIFYGTLPNYQGYDFLEIGQVYRNLFAPTHLNYFNPKSLEILLKKNGFKEVEIITDGVLDVSLVESYNKVKKIKLSDFWSMIYENDEYKDFLSEFQNLLSKYKLSGNMTFIARK